MPSFAVASILETSGRASFLNAATLRASFADFNKLAKSAGEADIAVFARCSSSFAFDGVSTTTDAFVEI